MLDETDFGYVIGADKMVCLGSWGHDQLDVRVYNVVPFNGTKAVCPCPDRLLINVPVVEANLSEE